jgi:hypothetical protein
MSYRPDESTLISYLYEELEAKENGKVEQFLQANPEEQKKLQQMADVLGIMRHVQDKEVIAPPIFMDDAPRARSVWMSGYFKTVVGIAATLLLLLVAARLIGPEIRYSQGELRISFAEKKISPPAAQPPSGLSPEQVQEMINSSLVKNNEAITAGWSETQKQLSLSIRQNLDLNSRKIDGLMKDASLASQDQVRAFVASMQSDNLKSIREYMQLSSAEQNKYMEGLLVDFSKYLNEQRNQDLQLFQARIGSIERNTDEFKQETEQILSSLISSSGNETKKQSSYE